MTQRSYLYINYSNFAHANEPVIPPVIYRDLVMEKLHFPDTGVVMGPVIPAPQALPPPEVVAIPLQVRGVPSDAPSPGRPPHSPASAPDPAAAGAVAAGGCLPSPSNRLGGNGINTPVIKTRETGFKAES